jgi:diguanylate cyclase (GGDEF)-like protein
VVVVSVFSIFKIDQFLRYRYVLAFTIITILVIFNQTEIRIGILIIVLLILLLVICIFRQVEKKVQDAKLLFDLVPTPLVMITRNDWKLVRLNQAAAALLDIAEAEVAGKCITDFLGVKPEDYVSWSQLLNHDAMAGTELPIYRGSDLVLVMTFTSSINLADNPYLILSLIDITAKHIQTTQLEQLASTDGMTGLLNRRTFREKLMLALLRAREANSELCLAFMDLDDLKAVNDTYGHREGDGYINTFVSLLRNSTSENDIVGRVGGDEFAIVFTKCSQHAAEDCTRRIQHQLESIASCSGKPYTMWVSVGVVSIAAGTEIDAESLLHKADIAMYQQKYRRRQKNNNERTKYQKECLL